MRPGRPPHQPPARLPTASPVDLAKLLLRLRAQAALAPAALLGVGSRAPRVVEGDDPMPMHRAMATAMDACLADIRAIQQAARQGGETRRRSRR